MKKTILEKNISEQEAINFFEYQEAQYFPGQDPKKIEHVVSARLANIFGSKKISFVHISYYEIEVCQGYKMESFSCSTPCIRLQLPKPMLTSQERKIRALVPDLARQYIAGSKLPADHPYMATLQDLASALPQI